jgi:hypothetical protein
MAVNGICVFWFEIPEGIQIEMQLHRFVVGGGSVPMMMTPPVDMIERLQ